MNVRGIISNHRPGLIPLTIIPLTILEAYPLGPYFNIPHIAPNELTGNTNGGKITVMGTATSSNSTTVTVNSSNALVYGDATFAATNMPLTTGYTAIAADSYGRHSTNTVTVNLSTNNAAYQYDGNGNLTNDGTRSFAYDDENQLIQVWVPNQWFSQFTYDGKMRRRIRQEYTWQGSAWVQTNVVYYVYDGNEVVQERNISGLPTTTYTRGQDLSGSMEGAGGIGGLLSMTLNTGSGPTSSNTYYYHADGNGNVTMLINASQNIVAKYLYDAFGNVLSGAGSVAQQNLYRFSSKEAHANSGLVYYVYRFYDPNLQRWPNRDPMGEPGFENLRNGIPFRFRRVMSPNEYLQGANLYAFVDNDGINVFDIDGRGFVDCAKALAKLTKAQAKLDLRLAQIAADPLGTGLDPGHEKALAQALANLADAYRNVAQHCGCEAAAAAALAAAGAAIQEASELLQEMQRVPIPP